MTFLPLRASELGMSQTLIGLSGSAYFAGFMTGALLIPPVIARVGHIRSFTALMAIFLSSFLFLSLVAHVFFFISQIITLTFKNGYAGHRAIGRSENPGVPI